MAELEIGLDFGARNVDDDDASRGGNGGPFTGYAQIADGNGFFGEIFYLRQVDHGAVGTEQVDVVVFVNNHKHLLLFAPLHSGYALVGESGKLVDGGYALVLGVVAEQVAVEQRVNGVPGADHACCFVVGQMQPPGVGGVGPCRRNSQYSCQYPKQ